MRTDFLLAPAIVVLLLLAACDGGSGSNGTGSVSESPIDPPVDTPVEPPVEPPPRDTGARFLLGIKGSNSPWSSDSSHIAYIIEEQGAGENGYRLMFLVPVDFPAAAAPTGSFQSSDIVFVSSPEAQGAANLYGHSVANRSTVRLNPPMVAGGNVTRIKVSPNGRYIAYIADQTVDGVFELHIASADGSVSVLPGPVRADEDLFWAPDSSAIAYIGRQRRTLNISSPSGMPFWSLAVEELGLADSPAESNLINGDIVALFPNTSANQVLEYQWSPSSLHIAVHLLSDDSDLLGAGGLGDFGEVRIYRRDGEQLLPLGNNVFGVLLQSFYSGITGPSFRWSPDGSMISTAWGPWSPGMGGVSSVLDFSVVEDESYTISSIGLNQNSGGSVAGAPSWSPDSNSVAFFRGFRYSREGQSNLYIAQRLENPVSFPISTHCSSCYLTAGNPFPEADVSNGVAPTWSPNGDLIAYIDQIERAVYLASPAEGTFVTLSPPLLNRNTDVVFGLSPGQLNNDGTAFDVWSPDGKRIFYLADDLEDQRYVLFSALVDGSVNDRIGTVTSGGLSPLRNIPFYAKWSEDGSRILYLSGDNKPFELRLASGDGAEQYTITEYVDPGNVDWLRR